MRASLVKMFSLGAFYKEEIRRIFLEVLRVEEESY
jgi:hypothetical protein